MLFELCEHGFNIGRHIFGYFAFREEAPRFNIIIPSTMAQVC